MEDNTRFPSGVVHISAVKCGLSKNGVTTAYLKHGLFPGSPLLCGRFKGEYPRAWPEVRVMRLDQVVMGYWCRTSGTEEHHPWKVG